MDRKLLKAMGVDLCARPYGTTTGWRQKMQRDTGGRRWRWGYDLAPYPPIYEANTN